ncbi:MAG: cell division protein FtsL [Desulfobacterota bacterium]|nr:cell division protein FtsL [Thermodesulfobacteriota bacterium]
MLGVARMTERFIHTNVLARQNIKRDTDTTPRDAMYIVCMAVLLLAAFFLALWVRIYFIEIGYRISDAYRTHEALLQENKRLKLERAELRAPSRIERIATSKLGMAVPRPDQTVTLPWSK